jgi:hypothetical protein
MAEKSDKRRRSGLAGVPSSVEELAAGVPVATSATIGAVIAHERKLQGLSQDELGLLSDIPRSYLSEIEAGVTVERLERIFAALRALGLELVVRRRDLRRGDRA